MRKLLVVLVVLVVIAGVVYVVAGSRPGPRLEIVTPAKIAGADTPVDVAVDAPAAKLTALEIALEQNGTRTTLATLASGTISHGAADGPDRVHAGAKIGKATVPSLVSGTAKLVVTASRPVLFGLRQVSSTTSRDLQVRLEKPRLTVLSTHHYINVGGSEMIVYRVEPNDVASGVAVGDLEYPGFPATGAAGEGVHITDPGIRIAFFALLYDQPANTPMHLFARDEAGNTATAEFDHQTFPKAFRASHIPLDDKFLDRVVPAILAGTKEVAPEGTTIQKFVVINSELRRKNAETIRSMAAKTAPDMLWQGATFHPFTNNAVESAFADRRTYIYQGKEVDHQTHLGFDLASTMNATLVAANRGRVVFAQELGIYGNCVIIDHGMGVQSLYGHLSSLAVKAGDDVTLGQTIGKSGMTGLAGGDHLHFTMLVNGQMVNPVEWWDTHWIADRVLRKLREVH